MSRRGKPRRDIPLSALGMAIAGPSACNHARENPHDTRKITTINRTISYTDIMAITEKPTKYNRHIVT